MGGQGGARGRHGAAVKLAQAHRGKRQHELCVYVCVRSAARRGSNGSIADSMGGTPKFKEAGAP